ncbi:MAG: RNA-directed DNA polymerase [Bacteroidia bacterium]|nr:RNA-directed DNA polymerase [Bacteroidia bacterium]
MKSIIELNKTDAKEFLLKEKSYINFDLPTYFSFQNLLNLIDKQLTGKKLSDFRILSPRDFDDINYYLLNNKDGKYAWRPYQIINPAIYVSLVHCITEKDNWKLIQKRFTDFQKNNKIECHSLPMVSESEEKTDKESQIFTWWQMIEQKSITLSLDYHYILQTDITDCYGSIYTHSISWAIHTKLEAKKKENRKDHSLLGVAIDDHLQDMSYGQTNGIPQGSTLMDFIAEIVLGYVDELLANKINDLGISDYKILRYRDDYRIFTNNPFEAEQITKSLSEILTDIGLKLNVSKTEASDNVIKSSIKPDKRYWIINKRITENKQKWLIQLFLLSELFPNSGTLDTQMKEFLSVLEKSKREDANIESLISLVTEIACRNPRIVPTSIGILSLLVKKIPDRNEKKIILKRIYNKFQQIPNSSFLKVWLQRLTVKIDKTIIYDEPICKLISDSEVQLWNIEWLRDNFKSKIKNTPIIIQSKVKTLKAVVTKKEIDIITTSNAYDYE